MMVGMSKGSGCGFFGVGERGMVGGWDEDGWAGEMEMEMETEVGVSDWGGVLVTVTVVVLGSL